MAPSIALAVLHGVLGQVFLGLMVAIAVVTSRWWRQAPAAEPRPTVGGDRSLQLWLVATLVVQLVLGAVQRHLAWGLIIHISLAAVVVMLAVIAGARAWGLYHGVWPVQRLGQALIGGVEHPGDPRHRGAGRDPGAGGGGQPEHPRGNDRHRPPGHRSGTPRARGHVASVDAEDVSQKLGRFRRPDRAQRAGNSLFAISIRYRYRMDATLRIRNG